MVLMIMVGLKIVIFIDILLFDWEKNENCFIFVIMRMNIDRFQKDFQRDFYKEKNFVMFESLDFFLIMHKTKVIFYLTICLFYKLFMIIYFYIQGNLT